MRQSACISKLPQEPSELLGRSVSLLLDALEGDPVLVPPALEGGDDVLPVLGDVAAEDGVEFGSQNAEHQLARYVFNER